MTECNWQKLKNTKLRIKTNFSLGIQIVHV